MQKHSVGLKAVFFSLSASVRVYLLVLEIFIAQHPMWIFALTIGITVP